ncbi:tyrosine-type recombinase/integrase, partial [Candidatus Uhrbacteria bacterium]|nr:tyrosine-type recombinase/integrase [Candidatus Uhrbacteria bacterium]
MTSSSASRVYQHYLDKFLLFSPEALEDISMQHIVAYKKHIDENLQNTSVYMAFVALRTFFGYCQTMGYKTINYRAIQYQKYKVEPIPQIHDETYERMLALCDTTNFHGLRNSLAIRMLYDTGVRVRELVDLNTEQVTQQPCSATIFRRKLSKYRPIFWSQTTQNYLESYLSRRTPL